MYVALPAAPNQEPQFKRIWSGRSGRQKCLDRRTRRSRLKMASALRRPRTATAQTYTNPLQLPLLTLEALIEVFPLPDAVKK